MGQIVEMIVAFAGIMLGLSLAITILNQLVANILGLRGTSLKWGIVTLLEETSSASAGDAFEDRHHVSPGGPGRTCGSDPWTAVFHA